MSKNCIHCNNVFEKKTFESVAYWATKKFCSHACYWLDKKGKIPTHVKLWKKGEQVSPSTQFVKGHPSLNKGKKQPQTVEHYMKRVAAMPRGERHHNWKGGVTSEHEKIRKSPEYKQWRMAVLSRDYFTCKECGYKGRDIEADHIKPFYLHPELRLEVDNGRTLCKPCHRKTETWGRKVYLLVGQNI